MSRCVDWHQFLSVQGSSGTWHRCALDFSLHHCHVALIPFPAFNGELRKQKLNSSFVSRCSAGGHVRVMMGILEPVALSVSNSLSINPVIFSGPALELKDSQRASELVFR